MAEFTDIEKEFRISLSSPDFDVSRGIEVALQIEERGRKFYSEKARSVSEALRPFFRFLAEQEREHENTLDGLRKALRQVKLWVKVPQSHINEPLRDFSAFRRHAGNEHAENAQDIEAILHAMRMEKATREFYVKFADAVRNTEGRAFFMALADWEKKHYELLSGLYNASSYTRLET